SKYVCYEISAYMIYIILTAGLRNLMRLLSLYKPNSFLKVGGNAIFVLYIEKFIQIFVVDFFFSSRRRHTIFSRDWSSDVCSSDLPGVGRARRRARAGLRRARLRVRALAGRRHGPRQRSRPRPRRAGPPEGGRGRGVVTVTGDAPAGRPARAAWLYPDTLSALEEERDFLLRSLDDLEREHEAGDVDDHDYEVLKDDYTARAARVIRAIETHQARLAAARRPRSRRRVALTTLGVVAFAVLAGVLVADAA